MDKIESKLNNLKKIAILCLVFSFHTVSFATQERIEIETIKDAKHFVTWQGIEPDKWASLWLIKRYIAPDAYFSLKTPNSKLPENIISFGTTNDFIKRKNKTSMFRVLKNIFNKDIIEINYIDQIINDIEVNIWNKYKHPHSIWFEHAYRKLLADYDKNNIPIDCYLMLFDKTSKLATQTNISAEDYTNALKLPKECTNLDNTVHGWVKQINHLDVLREIGLGKTVIFIDSREKEEYNESHIPGAKWLPLRHVNKDTISEYFKADLVIPYCVKDFRGFEVAKSMKLLGLNQVATLSPNGLKGWIDSKLPLVKQSVTTDDQARDALLECAMDPMICLKRTD